MGKIKSILWVLVIVFGANCLCAADICDLSYRERIVRIVDSSRYAPLITAENDGEYHYEYHNAVRDWCLFALQSVGGDTTSLCNSFTTYYDANISALDISGFIREYAALEELIGSPSDYLQYKFREADRVINDVMMDWLNNNQSMIDRLNNDGITVREFITCLIKNVHRVDLCRDLKPVVQTRTPEKVQNILSVVDLYGGLLSARNNFEYRVALYHWCLKKFNKDSPYDSALCEFLNGIVEKEYSYNVKGYRTFLDPEFLVDMNANIHSRVEGAELVYGKLLESFIRESVLAIMYNESLYSRGEYIVFLSKLEWDQYDAEQKQFELEHKANQRSRKSHDK